MIKKEAEELQIPEDNVTEPVAEANDKLTGYKEDAEEERESIAKALNKTKTAGAAAKRAREKIKEVLDKLLALLKEVKGVGTVNISRLDQLDNQLNNVSLRELDREVMGVEETSLVITEKIRLFTIDLKRLRAEKARLQGRYEKLPKVCPRVTPQTEGP